MAVYKKSTTKYDSGSIPLPDQSIDPRDKNEEWGRENAEYIYSSFLSGRSAFTIDDHDKIELMRAYAGGSQPTDIYKKRIYSALGDAKSKRESWRHIDFENLFSPMPKFMNKIEGILMSQDHITQATAVSERARVDRKMEKVRKYVSMELKPLRDAISQLSGVQNIMPAANDIKNFQVNDHEELEILSNSGLFKLPYEVAAEKAIDYTVRLSDYPHIKRKAIRDLVCSNACATLDYVDNHTNKVKWKYIDITDVIIEYSNDSHFKDSRYFGIQEWWTIGDLVKNGVVDEDGAKKLAKKFRELNTTRNFATFDKYYGSSKSYGYYEWRIPVLYCGWRSVDVKYLNKVKIKNGETRLYDGDFGKIKSNTKVLSTEVIYECRWVIGEDIVFDFDKMGWIPRDGAGNIELPLHVTRLEGRSIVESAKHTLDELAIIGYKIQDAWAKAVPSGYIYDYSQMLNLTDSTAGKIHPLDAIEMHMETGDAIVMSEVDGQPNYNSGAPITRIDGGIGNMLNEFLLSKKMYLEDLVELTGVSNIEAQYQQASTATEARLAVASTSDVLKPIYSAFISNKEKLSYNTVYRIQLICHHNRGQGYNDAIGEHMVKILGIAYDKEPMDFGVKFESMPTEEQRQVVLTAAQSALAAGKSGQPLLRISEYLSIVRNINSLSGLKSVEMLIAYREIQDEKKAFAMQQAAIQAQGKEIQMQQMVKNEGVAFKENLKGQIDLTKQQQKADLDLRNQKELEGVGVGRDILNRAVDMAAKQGDIEREFDSNQNSIERLI